MTDISTGAFERIRTGLPSSPGEARLAQAWRGWQLLRASPAALTGLAIILALLLVALFAPQLAPETPYGQALDRQLVPPSWDHPFGTDEFGRDVLSRVINGARYTLYIVVLVAVIAAPVGLLVGASSGYLGGWIDTLFMRITDIALAFPRLILALAFVTAFGPGLNNAIIAIALTGWPPYVRIARAEALTMRKSDYIAAVELMGASRLRIILVHVVPLCLPSLFVRMTLDMAGVILIAAGLGFLGLGAQPPAAEWGVMLSNGKEYLLSGWWVATFPGLAIFFVCMGFNLLGDGLRDILDPRHEA
ncbi:cytochrome c550 [Primorskyibacter flagellatus]|uniref:Cytochrome c550 n=1 Tax=Primorskyibacter flagellatus TaxID=1387277 RepID=A0A917EJ99_9RHOB|nr:ABC transporter permease [Primorskyibacter flagellatus]GGE50217.1 cytochrome c550 [Primorskyibacter flagellatus]